MLIHHVNKLPDCAHRSLLCIGLQADCPFVCEIETKNERNILHQESPGVAERDLNILYGSSTGILNPEIQGKYSCLIVHLTAQNQCRTLRLISP